MPLVGCQFNLGHIQFRSVPFGKTQVLAWMWFVFLTNTQNPASVSMGALVGSPIKAPLKILVIRA